MESLDDAVGLRAPDYLGLAMLDTFELAEQLVGVAVEPAAALAAII